MKTILTSCFLTACLLALTSCSSTNTKIDTGPIPAHTFNFIQPPAKPVPTFADNRKEVHALFQKAIADSLARRQVNRVEQNPDVIVAYLLIVGNNAVTTSMNDYFGYGRDAAGLVDKAHKEYGDSRNPNYFEAGTLVIDIIDAKTWKVLKRGYTTRALVANVTPEQQAARASEVVEAILADVSFHP